VWTAARVMNELLFELRAERVEQYTQNHSAVKISVILSGEYTGEIAVGRC
jgi:hypothetical protein